MNNGWTTKKLDDVVESTTIGLVRNKNQQKDDFPYDYVKMNNIANDNRFSPIPMARVDAIADELERFHLRDGDFLFNTRNSHELVGKSCVYRALGNGPVLFNNNIMRIRFSPDLLPDFAGYAFSCKLVSEQLRGMVSGTTNVAGIYYKHLKDLTIPIPPLPEQRRIVGILDEAFAAIATAKANTDKNLQNAHALFEGHLNAAFTSAAQNWETMPLEDVVDVNCTLSYGIVQPGDDQPDGLPIVRPTDLTAKAINLNGLKRIDPQRAAAYRRTSLIGGELLLCVRGSTGVVGVASQELAGANVTRGIVPIRFNRTRVSQSFGYFALTSEPTQKQIRAKTYGAALMQINIGDLRKVTLSFPKLDQQEAIANRLDTLASETQRLASLYQRKLAALDELKKSLLHQAFTGRL